MIRVSHAQREYVSAVHRSVGSLSYTLDIRMADHQNAHVHVVQDHVSERMHASIASIQMDGFWVA